MKRGLLVAFLTATVIASAQVRQETTLTDDWQFSQDKKTWQNVSIPHDWAIAGPFDKKWDLQKVAIEQNGETEATEKSGRSGALPWIGEGHYRRTLTIPAGCEHAELIFDGAMAEPVVFINGQKAGYWAYGYNAFRVDITPFIKDGDNLLEVDLKNVEESSRWYPGAGIYRPVTLLLTQQTHLDDWSIYVRTVSQKDDKAVLEVEGKVIKPNQDMSANVALVSPDGHTAVTNRDIHINGDGSFHTTLNVEGAKWWTPETPYLYKLITTIADSKGKVVDEKCIKTGIRTIRVTREKGFQLNGQTRKLKGVCLHHDLGPLGVAINKAALIRQIKMMKQMGCDAIRTAEPVADGYMRLLRYDGDG